MGYLSCRADSSVATCRSISATSPSPGRKSSKSSASTSTDGDGAAAAATIEQFSYDELQAATSNFADAALLGRGSHGAVYKAVLPGGRAVAVKRPSRRLSPEPAAPRRDEVENEIEILSSVRSPRLVNLLGYAAASGSPQLPRLLVVEYMPNGTLYELLHSNPRPPGWARRMRLALQTAKALRTLHAADPPVIHRDIKSANVLLDANLDARLGDFGLALRAQKQTASANAAAGGVARATPPPAGTLGYLDPAYVTPENLSTKTDVFSFGILLLEIMSGRKAIDVAHSPPSVVEWAVPLLRKGKVAALFDPRVSSPRDPAARRNLAALAASCVRSCKERRPSMADIVEQLKALSKTVSSRTWNGLAVVGNPCAVVDIENTISKLGVDGSIGSDQNSSSVLTFDEQEEADTDALQDEASAVSVKKPPRPARNAKVFSEAGTRERKNLLELMARIDGVAGQRFGITGARTVRASHDNSDKDAMLLLRRNQTVKVVGSEALPKSECFASSEVKIMDKAEKHQGKEGKIQDEAEKIEDKTKKIHDKAGES